MKYIDVYIEDQFLFKDHLTYQTDQEVQVGMRVLVKVRNRERVAFIKAVYNPIPLGFKVATITKVIDEEPVINEELFALGHKMAAYYIAAPIACFQSILPNQLRPKGSFKKAKMERRVKLMTTEVAEHKLTPKQAELIALMEQEKDISYTQARKIYSGVQSLIKQGYLQEYETEARYRPLSYQSETHKPELTSAQKQVINSVVMDEFHTYLVHGVTGSGKTEIYLRLAEKVLENQEQVLILVPEISLTPQMIERFAKRFGEDVAMYHSALNNQEKYEQYQRVLKNEVNFIVGTRSAVFLPFKKLGLIIMDEEHDTSYKQNHAPSYHTRDIALWRAETHHCPLVLGSASPALETYARALKGNYTLLELPQRINQNFPQVTIVDTKEGLYRQKSAVLSDELKEGIQLRLNRQEQVMILLNRRGYLPILKDKKTGQVLQCPYCDVALNYHKRENLLKCHMCEYQTREQISSGEISGTGVGTERLTEHLKKLFPQANIARMDADTTSRKGAHKRILDDFTQGKYDILVGTQMIAKGLDIANVTLMGIVNADAGLIYQDYRSVEDTFAMLLQAAGRSGRAEKQGEVIIQSFNPDHYAITCAVHQKYKHFFKQEMAYRKLADYPPYSYLIVIVFSDEKQEKAAEAALLFQSLLAHDKIRMIGPSEIRRLANRYRNRIILKGRDLEGMIKQVDQTLQTFKTMNNTHFYVDVNPLNLE
ncbi:MAG TPA: primosomal protein N' [Erysipelothrix sp.]